MFKYVKLVLKSFNLRRYEFKSYSQILNEKIHINIL